MYKKDKDGKVANIVEMWERRLAQPFPLSQIEWRIQQAKYNGGKPWVMCLCYVTARACQQRLDEVFGVSGWKESYELIECGSEQSTDLNNPSKIHFDKKHGFICTLSLRDPETGEWFTKSNGSPETAVESFKGGFSKAFVRTCSNIGIGRYLYGLKENFGKVVQSKTQNSRKHYFFQEKQNIFWEPPVLPAWAVGQEQ